MLFIAYHFPPSGGAGAQRSVKFARYLPDHGWQPVVITRPASTGDRWTPADDALDREVRDRVQVVHVAGTQPPQPAPWRARAERLLRLSRAFTSWWVDGVESAGSALDRIDAVFATGSPFDSFEAAARISELRGVPWIADLRDPWAFDEMAVYPTGLHRALEVLRMRNALRTASAVVMNTPEATRVLLNAFPELTGARVVTIPNGFDASDFGGPPPERHDGAFRVVHTGYLHTELGRRISRFRAVFGGNVPGLQIITRSHVFLLEALERVAGSLDARIELHLAGVSGNADRTVANRRSVPVVMPGYVPHDRSVALVRSADALFLPMHDLPTGRRATIVPGKTYEYLASGRPILAAVPDGDARDLLGRAQGVALCRPSDVAGIAHALEHMIARWTRAGTATVDRSEILAPYERRALTAQLAGLLDAVVQ